MKQAAGPQQGVMVDSYQYDTQGQARKFPQRGQGTSFQASTWSLDKRSIHHSSSIFWGPSNAYDIHDMMRHDDRFLHRLGGQLGHVGFYSPKGVGGGGFQFSAVPLALVVL